jgi:ADP-heptose:LPS heptosyltransferase
LAKPSQDSAPTLLVTELWGLGDLALAIPFLRAASLSQRVTLVAKPHAAPLLSRFAPGVELAPFVAPWTAFRGKYRLLQWPWGALRRLVRELRGRRFDTGVSARPDPRDHALLAASGARRRLGFPRAGSGILLNFPQKPPLAPHRADHWSALAASIGVEIGVAPTPPRGGRRVVIHAGAGQPVRVWPRARYEELAASLRRAGWDVEVLDDSLTGVDRLIERLDSADRFIGNDSGPGHIAALLGVPTFTLFGPQLPELFAPRHPKAEWLTGDPCPYKPCSDYCRYPEAFCITSIGSERVQASVSGWLAR